MCVFVLSVNEAIQLNCLLKRKVCNLIWPRFDTRRAVSLCFVVSLFQFICDNERTERGLLLDFESENPAEYETNGYVGTVTYE